MKILILILCIGLFQIVYADEFDDAWAAYDKGDYVTAFKGIKRLAEQGDADAQYNLGVMYYNGHGVAQDYKEVVKWYSKGAKQGKAKAQYDLGVMYYYGQGVTQDFVHAQAWVNLAASQGNDLARENRDIISKKMTPQQIAEAQSLAREWAAKYNKE
jgi:hypothetical protein